MSSLFIASAIFPATSHHTQGGFYNSHSVDGERFRENDLPGHSLVSWSMFLQVHSPCFCTLVAPEKSEEGRVGGSISPPPPPPPALPVGHPGCVLPLKAVAPAKSHRWPLCLQVWEPDPPLTLLTFGLIVPFKLSPNSPA